MHALYKQEWERVLEGMRECPKCGGRTGVYTKTLIQDTSTYLFGCADVWDCQHFRLRGGSIFYCIDCGKPLFNLEGRHR